MSAVFLEVMGHGGNGLRIPVGGGPTTIGRASVLNDPSVSRVHAAIEVHGGRLVVRDLNSSNGTYVNGRRITGPVPVGEGDIVAFGQVETQLVTTAAPVYNVRDQHAGGSIHNVAGNQYNNYEVQRESFLAEIAARKSWGRALVWLGILANVVGFGMFAYGVIGFIQAIPDVTIDTPQSEVPSPFGPDAGGVPLGIIGFAIAGVGGFLLIVGIIFHVSAAARRRKMDQTLRPRRY
ncbi:FHA domain-containing protein [Dactylosporangium sp. CS-033363]|uniref:FHA domain-containing protein n=1 Tax=Dactylosporangium sp. CS-033363 TaxID=3239935 RepID=UPI003D913348